MTGSITGARFRRLGALVAVGVLATTLTACGGDDDSGDSANGGSGGGSGGTEVKLGYFPNLTHAPAIVGIEKGYFKDKIEEDGSTLKTLDFNSGSDTIDALLAGDLDITYIGPSPAITAYAKSHNVSLVSGVTSGGASLVVKDDITSADDLKGKTLATPGLANTQDVALKFWLKGEGYEVSPDGQGDVTVVNQDNSLSVQQFKSGDIDGAWLPEPYASELVDEGGSTLVDEATLWPEGKFVTTHILVNNDFLKEHADLVDDILAGNIEANKFIADNSDEAKQLTGDYIANLTGGEIPQTALDSGWDKLTFTNDPIADSLIEGASHAVDTGQLEAIDDLADIYSLDALNKLLADAGEPEVSGPSS